MYSRNIALFTLAILVFSIFGCGQDTHLTGDPAVPLGIEFCLAPGAASQASLTRMELTVSSPDMDEPLFFPITDVNSETRTARASITVPVGNNVTFFVKAFEEDCPALSGLLENVEVTPDRAAPVTIILAPIQIVIGIRSQQEQLNLGNNYVLEIYIEDAPRLFSFTCELEFDAALLEPVEIVPGEFFGAADDFLFMEDSQLPRNQRNRLSLGITRKGNDIGVCGSGTLFRMTFTAIGTGNAAIRLLRNDILTMTTPEPASERIEDSRIRVEPAVVIDIK